MIRVTQSSIMINKKEIDAAQEAYKTKGGIHVPDSVKDKTDLVEAFPMEVSACGPKCEEVKPGDKVVLRDGCSGIPIVKGDDTYVVFKEFDVVAIME